MNGSAFPHSRSRPTPCNRREFLWRSGGGLGGVALASMLDQVVHGSVAPGRRDGERTPHYPPRAKRVIQLFMAGAASHLDTFDYKPELIRQHGKESDFGEPVEAFQNGLGPWMQSPWEFRAHGQCGKYLSEVVSPLGSCVDDIAFLHNVVGKTGVHSQATYLQATGFQRPGFPGMGAWISYGLGSLSENLPTFVVMPDHRGYASNGPKNWASAFLPAEHQGTVVNPIADEPIRNLKASADWLDAVGDRQAFDVINRLNGSFAAERPGDSRLSARIQAYELAARMQLEAPEALDLSREPDWLKRHYGICDPEPSWPSEINWREEAHYMGIKCLTARRLLERGVRFVQIWSGNDNGFPRRNWDSHEDIERDHGPLARGMAQAIAALIEDLKQRGLFDDTIVLWTTEFGRLPSTQGSKGRDHNPYCFTNWLAGGGIRGGVTHGPSDPWGYKPQDRRNPTQVYDIHATMLHLLGVDHRRLTVRHDGIDRRLTDVHGHVISEILS